MSSRQARDWMRRVGRRCVGWRATPDRLLRPVFILSPPRSGSTLLLQILDATGAFWIYPDEATREWWRVFPSQSPVPHDRIARQAVDLLSARRLAALLYRAAVTHAVGHAPARIRAGHITGTAPIRYLDKTIANVFHIEALRTIFQGARFIVLTRDPRPTLSSMIEGWRDGRFRHPVATRWCRCSGRGDGSGWSYPAPPGWEAQLDRPLPERCAWLWSEHMRTLNALAREDSEGGIYRIRYEAILAGRGNVIKPLLDWLGIVSEEALIATRDALMRRSATTVSAPDPDKWLRHAAVIQGVLPLLRQEAESAGYELGGAS